MPTPRKGICQRRFGGPGATIQEQGDCWATAVACYGGLTKADRNELHRRIVLSDLAHKQHGTDKTLSWWNVTDRFLTERGLPQLTVADPEFVNEHPNYVYIASGDSPRGDFLHAILAEGSGELYWDPHPSGVGVPEITEWIAWWQPPKGDDDE